MKKLMKCIVIGMLLLSLNGCLASSMQRVSDNYFIGVALENRVKNGEVLTKEENKTLAKHQRNVSFAHNNKLNQSTGMYERRIVFETTVHTDVISGITTYTTREQ